MTVLRTGLVEAIARALYEDSGSTEPWESLPEDAFWKSKLCHKASVSLDSALGFLSDNAESWEQEVEHFSAATQVYGMTARRLIAVLRDIRETE